VPVRAPSVCRPRPPAALNDGSALPTGRFSFNVNGYVKETERGLQCTVGSPVSPSRPLWATVDKAPVLILGGFSKNKAVLLSDSDFEDFIAVEVDIDSCWIGSLTCPWSEFSSTILDAIATESTLFIRQNQLVYYFTGNYSVLHMATPGSTLWTRVLNRVCVGKLNPVPFSHNGSEYVIAIGRGQQKADFFLGTIRGRTRGRGAHRGRGSQPGCHTRIQWAVYIPEENKTLLLVEQERDNATSYHVVPAASLPLPAATEKSFVMLMGFEEYSDTPMVLRGLSYNPFSTIFYIWGNAILQSYDIKNYLFLSGFPSQSVIKYFIQSYKGEVVCVTEAEEVWFLVEGSSAVQQLYPSSAWSTYANIQLLRGSQDYGVNESSLSFFYNQEGLQQLVYIHDRSGRIVKRKFPIAYILSELRFIGFTNLCPFTVMKFRDLPKPQRFSRLEHYRAEPPVVTDETGFHDNKSLAVYQGLVFHLLWLHSDYNRPYADPVHDPTWRWWKNRKQDADYYLYLASTGSSPGGLYINMEHYTKVYDLRSDNELPEQIYLDKGDAYTFSVTLSVHSTADDSKGKPLDFLSRLKLTVVLSHPFNVGFSLQRQNLANWASVLYKVRRGAERGPRTGVGTTSWGPLCHRRPCRSGYRMVPVYVGCPPGKRMAFDITNTVQYTTSMNKRYFNCLSQNPEMPCFFFKDVFYPLFLIQDMVTGDSGSFSGRYTLKVIGAPTTASSERRDERGRLGAGPRPLCWGGGGGLCLWGTAKGSRTWQCPLPGDTEPAALRRWLCRRNSPCHDVAPVGLTAPNYFFLVAVSNRDVDTSTYCDYSLEFVIHVHGLQLSSTRKLFFMKVGARGRCPRPLEHPPAPHGRPENRLFPR
uniref:Cation channel sperm associated auxiliary subunit gamma n=1 Tax=Dromaius novaehollandiae TaxID=8790 RepID=A0A8C4JNV8_DRONO